MEDKSVKSEIKTDIKIYYGAAVALLLVSCISLMLIINNVFGSSSDASGLSSSGVKTENTAGVSETEEELKISHAGLAGNDSSSDKSEEVSPALRNIK
ncbi:hypothetical protein [Oribacterium sp. WCC10]|uniref:hypothetical protein n=1 Tax=Oribacterium sp. WCC10 TaxID=1855343 RepID=UPI0008EAEC0F|nr:hypothetical protein [Oribacterium sp. WCC10]SFG27007.1 hypothetical protein SAMN05216356_104177 [Oribacterium sp. WCC10]